MNVPAGAYVVTGTENFESNTATPGLGECWIADSTDNNLDPVSVTVPSTGGTSNRGSGTPYGGASVTNQAVVQLASAGHISEVCDESQDSNADIEIIGPAVTAVAIGGLN